MLLYICIIYIILPTYNATRSVVSIALYGIAVYSKGSKDDRHLYLRLIYYIEAQAQKQCSMFYL